jgi:hypothetical protein
MADRITDFNEEQIDEYLKHVFICTQNGNYKIAKQGNRVKNDRFMILNNISDAKAVEIIESLTAKDFCYAMNNDNPDPKYCDEVLYLFCKEIEHNVRGRLVDLAIFIKINLINPNEFVFIVSFHKFDRDKDGNIPYLFNR